jgi:O-antigen/teichoic acid export membrane protein
MKKIFSNLVLLLGGKAAAGLISLAYLFMATHLLGASQFGILILVHAYATLIGSVIAFSGWHGIVRYGTIAHQDSDHGRLVRLVRFMTLVETGCGIIAILIAALLVPVAGSHLHWPPEVVRLAVPYTLAILATVRSTPQGILQIAGRFDLISAHNLINPTVRLTGCVLIWALGGGLIAFLVVWLAASLAEWLGMWLFGLFVLGRLDLNEPLVGPLAGTVRENAGLLPFIVTTNVDLTLSELAPKLAPLAVGWMLGPAATGIFSLAQRASNLLQQPATLLGQASYAVLARNFAAGHYQQFRKMVWKSGLVATLIACPIVITLGFFSDRVLFLLGGHSFVGGGLLLFLMAAGRGLSLFSVSLSSGLLAAGRQYRSIIANLIGSLGMFPLLPLMILLVGLSGAGWHALAQSAVTLGLLAWLFLTTPNPDPAVGRA